jgi:endonuclease/exonuclease/phosphatase family metal-dependent hydrolase
MLALFQVDGAAAVAMQEMGDQAFAKEALRDAGYGVYEGTLMGAPSTPIAWDPKQIEVKRVGTTKLVNKTFVPPEGAGGRTMKQKNLVWIQGRHIESGRLVTVASTHLPPSQYLPVRMLLAIQHIRGSASWVPTMPGLVFIMGDFNTRPDAKVLMPLRKKRMASTHDMLGEVATHGRRAIDFVWFRIAPRRLRAVDHYAKDTHSDHRALVAKFRVEKKKRLRP